MPKGKSTGNSAFSRAMNSVSNEERAEMRARRINEQLMTRKECIVCGSMLMPKPEKVKTNKISWEDILNNPIYWNHVNFEAAVKNTPAHLPDFDYDSADS